VAYTTRINSSLNSFISHGTELQPYQTAQWIVYLCTVWNFHWGDYEECHLLVLCRVALVRRYKIHVLFAKFNVLKSGTHEEFLWGLSCLQLKVSMCYEGICRHLLQCWSAIQRRGQCEARKETSVAQRYVQEDKNLRAV
jgi:hypothetical protein